MDQPPPRTPEDYGGPGRRQRRSSDREATFLLSTAWFETYSRAYLPTVGSLVSEDGLRGCDQKLDMEMIQNQDERNVRKEMEDAMRTRTLEEEVMEREGREKEYYDTQMKMTGGEDPSSVENLEGDITNGEDDADDDTNPALEDGDNNDDKPVTAAASKKDPLDYWTDKLEKELKQKFFEDEDNNDDDITAENILYGIYNYETIMRSST